jgi:hypothetical protein
MSPNRADLPEYNPVVLVARVQDLLAREGVTVVIDLHSAQTAIYAASDLLMAIGVQPANSPARRSVT